MTPNSSSVDESVPSARQTLRHLFLTLFLRGRSSRGLQKEAAPKSVGRKIAGTLLWYGLFGLFAIMFRDQPIFMLSAYLHAMTLMFLGMFIASSAGEILFNREEADILMHRPIEPRALLWAKVWVLTEVSLWLAGAFNLAGFFVGAVSPGGSWWYLPVHAASSALQALFCTGCVVMVYELCLRWFGRDRLEGLMIAAQVLLTVAIILSGQMLPEILEFYKQGKDVAATMWWIVLLPPAWFAGIDDALAGSGATGSWLLAGAGCLATAVVVWLAFGKLAQNYEAGLQLLNEGSSRRVSVTGGRRRLDRLIDLPPLRWWLRDPRQRAAFLLTAAYLVRDRDVKLRIYPAVVPFLILPIVFIAREVRHSDDPLGGAFGLVFASGYVGMVPLMAVNLLQFSQNWQAADVFRSAPLAGPAPICHGARKAVLCLLTLPLVVVLALGAWFVQQDLAALMLLLPGIIVLPLVALIPNRGGGAIPLSRPIDEAKSASRGMTLMATMMATMMLSVLAMVAWTTGWLTLLLIVESIVVAVLYVIVRRKLDRDEWPPME